MEKTDYVTVTEAAQLAGVTDRCIRKAIQRGDLAARTDSRRRRYVRYQDLQAWSPKRAGRPRKRNPII